MRTFIIYIFLCFQGSLLFGQQLPEIARPKILIVADVKDGLKNFTAKDIAGLFEDLVLHELFHQITCADFMTKGGIRDMLMVDRTKTLLTGDSESLLSEIAGAMGCDYLISLGAYAIGDDFYLTGSTTTTRNAKVAAKSISKTDYDQLIKAMQKYGRDLATDLLSRGICPFKGKITINTEKTDEEIHERGNRCGKNNSGYFRETIHKSLNYKETLVLEKKRHIQADGSLLASSTDENIWHQINSNCVLCATYDGDAVVGTDAGNYTNSEYMQTKKEEMTVEGLAPLDKNPLLSYKLPAEVAINFDTIQGTYMVRVKAVSKTGIFIKSKTVKNVTSCKTDNEPDEESKNDIVVSISSSYGPFKGRPRDKKLEDSKKETFTTKHDGGVAVSTYQVNFSFTR